MIPDDLRYTAEHEWVRASGSTVRVGITHFAQDSLGDVVFVELPEPGAAVTAGQAVGEIESTKSVSDVYSPVTGTVSDYKATLKLEAISQPTIGVGVDRFGAYAGGGIAFLFSDLLNDHMFGATVQSVTGARPISTTPPHWPDELSVLRPSTLSRLVKMIG